MPPEFSFKDIPLKNLLRGITNESQLALDAVLTAIGNNPNIAWYPSAGTDFRDLLEVGRTSIQPNLHIHTDYHLKWNKLELGDVFKDDRTAVRIKKIDELEFNKPIKFRVDSEFVDFPMGAPKRPIILLLDVEIKSMGSKINTPTIYIFMENINFLDEVILKHKLNISHIIKIREGMAWGGNRKSISVAYAFLSNMNTKYILIDNKVDADHDLIEQLTKKHDIQLKNYEIRNIAQGRNISNWGGLKAKVMKIESRSSEGLNRKRLHELLNVLR